MSEEFRDLYRTHLYYNVGCLGAYAVIIAALINMSHITADKILVYLFMFFGLSFILGTFGATILAYLPFEGQSVDTKDPSSMDEESESASIPRANDRCRDEIPPQD